MSDANTYTARQVYDLLMSQRFHDWYTTKFEHHVSEGDVSEVEILEFLDKKLSGIKAAAESHNKAF